MGVDEEEDELTGDVELHRLRGREILAAVGSIWPSSTTVAPSKFSPPGSSCSGRRDLPLGRHRMGRFG
jgi:hypothetical protein